MGKDGIEQIIAGIDRQYIAAAEQRAGKGRRLPLCFTAGACQ
jgi:hypothetical protein